MAAQYRLHFAGSTFDLKDEKVAHALVAEIESVQAANVGKRVTVDLVDGQLQIFISRYVSIALMAVPERVPFVV